MELSANETQVSITLRDLNSKSKVIMLKVHFIQIHKLFISTPVCFGLQTILRDKD
jgi:hypothetical protein